MKLSVPPLQFLAAVTPDWLRPYAKRIYRAARSTRTGTQLLPASVPPPLPPPDENAAMFAAAENPGEIGIGRSATGREIVMLVVSDLRVDPRVEREAVTLAAAGYHVTVYCPDPSQGEVPDLRIDWGENIDIRFLHWSTASFVMHAPGLYGGKLFEQAVKHRPLAFHAHDLNTAFAARAAARATGAHLVVDFHEWFSENVSWNAEEKQYFPHESEWKLPMQALERVCLKEASAIVTVCDSIADAMATELGEGRKPLVVRNIPSFRATPTKSYPSLKAQFGLPEDQFVLLYQGGTGPTRLLEPIIESLGQAKHCVLIIRGPSLQYFEAEYRKLAAGVGASDRLILAPPVPSRDVVAAARGADAGIWSLPKLSRNFYYALPNKIFEYLAAGLPLAGANFPEVKAIIDQHRVGVTFDPYDARSIGAALQKLADPEFRSNCRQNIATALKTLDAEQEWQKLVRIYDGLQGNSERSPVYEPVRAADAEGA